MNIEDFVIVKQTVCFAGGRPSVSTYMVLRSELELYWEAALRLHHAPGVNPHTGLQTAELLALEVYAIGARGPFWWTSPTLHAECGGARLWEEGALEKRWVRPDTEPRGVYNEVD